MLSYNLKLIFQNRGHFSVYFVDENMKLVTPQFCLHFW